MTCLLALTLALSLAHGGHGPTAEELKGHSFDELVVAARGGAQAAVDLLAASGDPRTRDTLVSLLDQAPMPEVRIQAAKTILSQHPSEAKSIFTRLLLQGTSLGREAAAQALGMVSGPGVEETLVSVTADADPRVRAAANAALARSRIVPVLDATVYNLGAEREHALGEVATVTRLRRALLEVALSRQVLEPRSLLLAIADRDAAAALRDGYARQTGDSETARLVQRMAHANRRWLGSQEIPRFKRVSYDYHMENLLGGKPWGAHLTFTPFDLELLGVRRFRLDRASLLSLPLDTLLVGPQMVLPSLAGEGDGSVSLRYRIPEGIQIATAIGLWTPLYFAQRQLDGLECVVTIESARALPTSEAMYSLEGELKALITYHDYVQVDPDSWVPKRITVRWQKPLADYADILHQYAFEVAPGGLWHLSWSQATELADAGDRPLAEACVSNLVITPERPPVSSTRLGATSPDAP